MILSLIVAYTKDSNNRQVIGKDGKIPWEIAADMAWFRDCTKGHAVVMGRKTYESIGHPLPARDNIIVTRDPNYEAPGAHVFHTLEDALDFAGSQHHEVFVIGGQTLYEQCLARAERIYVSHIKKNPGYEGDTFFPEWKRPEFKVIQRDVIEDPDNGPVSYKIFQRFKYTHEKVESGADSPYNMMWGVM